MRTSQRHKVLTFGDLIAAVYGVCGKRRGRNIVRLAVNAHVITFRRNRHFLVS